MIEDMIKKDVKKALLKYTKIINAIITLAMLIVVIFLAKDVASTIILFILLNLLRYWDYFSVMSVLINDDAIFNKLVQEKTEMDKPIWED